MGGAKKNVTYDQLNHWLFTVCGDSTDTHAYVITDNIDRVANKIVNAMFDEAKKHTTINVPITTQTKISSSEALIHKILKRLLNFDEALGKVKSGEKQFLCSIWVMNHQHPDNLQLLELH
jgi:hypothetical protein